jgi:flagellar FliJ protein
MPRPFHFSLQRVLDYRAQLEEQAALALAKAQQAYTAQTGKVEDLRAQIAAHEQSLYADGAPSAQSMWLWRNYKERLQHDLSRAEQRALELARELNKARREAVNRSKERKLLEKLKSNQAMRHEEDEKLREQKEFDEMATLRYQPQGL